MPRSKQTAQQKAKTEEIASFIAKDGVTLVETTFDPERQPPLQFEVWKEGCPVSSGVVRIPCMDGTFVAPPADKNGLVRKGFVILPSRPADQPMAQPALLAEIVAFIHRYADILPLWEELTAHYVLMTWVYDRFTAVPYLRFVGERGTGKTRLLQVAGQLTYKAIFGGGSTTASPLFRLLEVWKGTLAVDEADYKNSDLWSEIIKVLNSGYMRGMPVLRASKNGDDYDGRAFDVFGPKILTTRKEFEDHALETRCLTLRTGDRKYGQMCRANCHQRSTLRPWNCETSSSGGDSRTSSESSLTSRNCSTWSRGSPRSARRYTAFRLMTASARGCSSSSPTRRRTNTQSAR
jgi:hypothetical protein